VHLCKRYEIFHNQIAVIQEDAAFGEYYDDRTHFPESFVESSYLAAMESRQKM